MYRGVVAVMLLTFVFAGCSAGTSSRSDAPDAGVGVKPPDASAPCLPHVVAMPTAPACAKATDTCIKACMPDDDVCADACFTADPNADACSECSSNAYVACVNTAGCQAEYDALECCTEGCPDPDADACTTVTCATQSAAYDNCAGTHDTTCSDAICFATM